MLTVAPDNEPVAACVQAPAAGAAHFKPVGETELSATNFGTISEDCSRGRELLLDRLGSGQH
jgi:hypothetical protein